jgi:hypothetical protein
MNNNTKIRLHLSKNLFENIAKEILAEAKKPNDGYTVAVKQPKMPKQSKSQAKAPEVQKTDAETKMEGGVPTSTSTTSVQDMNMGIDGKPAISGLKETEPKKKEGHDIETLKRAKAAIEKLLGEMETQVAETKEEEE